MTHYGVVIKIPPPIPPFTDDADQSVIVKLDQASLSTKPVESVDRRPSHFEKIEFFPIPVDTHGHLSDDPPPVGTYTILATENLTIENVSHLITADTFLLWKRDCFVSKDIADSLEKVKFAIVRRYSPLSGLPDEIDEHSRELVNMAVACLSLIRPTRRSRAMHIRGVIKPDGTFEPQGFSATHQPAEVPEIQKLFKIRQQDIDLLTCVLPEFIQLYKKDDQGRVKDEYEPLRMAVQLYEQAYALSYWKARHILWWSAIEALYGSNEDAAKARIYALFGNKDLVAGYHCSIYEKGDIPSFYRPSSDSTHTLGKTIPAIYAVRNASAHGQKVPDLHFSSVPHPFGTPVAGLDVLAEAATFIIRKTVIKILRRGLRDKFKDRDTREQFWLYHYGLDKKQSKKRLKATGTDS